MTSRDLQELERVQLEWYAARDAFEKAVQDGESLAEIDEALNTLQQKTAAYHAFGAKHIGPPPVSLASGNMSKVTQHLVLEAAARIRRAEPRRIP
jgi:hypothetical protein